MPSNTDRPRTRRAVVRAGLAGLVAGVAGCTGTGSDADPDDAAGVTDATTTMATPAASTVGTDPDGETAANGDAVVTPTPTTQRETVDPAAKLSPRLRTAMTERDRVPVIAAVSAAEHLGTVVDRFRAHDATDLRRLPSVPGVAAVADRTAVMAVARIEAVTRLHYDADVVAADDRSIPASD